MQLSCYTIVEKSETSSRRVERAPVSAVNVEPIISIVEGIVGYYSGINTRETYYHEAFILQQYNWMVNPPPIQRSVMYLEGSIDSSYMNKRVRIEGVYHIPMYEPRMPDSGPNYTSEMYFQIKDIQILP
jgi:hypothetical protein